MPLPQTILMTWVAWGAITFLVVSILRRKSDRAYAVIWAIAAISSILVLVYYLFWKMSVPLPSNRPPSNPDAWLPEIGLRELVHLFVVWPLSRVAPGFLISCGVFPPQMRNKWQMWLLGAICISIGIIIPARLLAWNQQYMNDFHQMTKQRLERGSARSEWRKKGPPDPKQGPTRWGHWTYMGCFPTYAHGYYDPQPESDLVSLTVGGHGPVLPEAWHWIERVQSLEEIRFKGELTDARIEHLKSLKNLRRLTLSRTPITDAGFAELAEIEALVSLELAWVPITGKGLQSLSEFPNLRKVNLIGIDATRGYRFSIPGWRHEAAGNSWRRK